MRPAHHPSDAVLTDYASGALRAAFAIVCAAHLEQCGHCRSRVGLLETIGGELLADLAPAEMDPDSLALAMAQLDRPAAAPAPPRGALVDRIRFGRRRWAGPGVWVRRAAPSVGCDDLLYLLRLPHGMSSVPHRHEGPEFTTVLKGGFSDMHGAFEAGDFAEMSEQDDHLPVVGDDAECICLIASARPMMMQTWLGRLVQALTGV